MTTVITVLSWILLVAGSGFCLLGGIGLLRFPDFYSRIHAASMTDSLGAPLILLGMMLQAGFSLVTIKLITVWIFLWLTSPASSHALAKAAYAGGLRVAQGPEWKPAANKVQSGISEGSVGS